MIMRICIVDGPWLGRPLRDFDVVPGLPAEVVIVGVHIPKDVPIALCGQGRHHRRR